MPIIGERNAYKAIINCWFIYTLTYERKVKVNQSHYRSEVSRGFQEVKIPRFYDKGTGWW